MEKENLSQNVISKIVDAAGEAGEIEVWIDIAKDAGYITSKEKYDELASRYEEVNRMLYGMIEKPDKFVLKLRRNEQVLQVSS